MNKNQIYPKKNNKNKNQIESQMMVTTPIFFNNMPIYCNNNNKTFKKKNKPFIEREGDWICKNCKNLNFSFRFQCNRCKLPKDSENSDNNKEEINQEHKNNEEINETNVVVNANNYCNFSQINEISH